MDFEEFSFKLKELLIMIGIEVSDKECENLYKYMNLLIEWNKRINLTAIIDPEEIILKHFVDSLMIEKYIGEGNKVIDVGTGAGLPGIPLSIIKENNEFILADSLNKRINFLEIVRKEIGINNVNLIHGRAEELARNQQYRQQYDIVVSRAVARLNILLEYMIPFLKIGGTCICMKAANCEEEISEANKAIELLGGKIEFIDKTTLPNTEILRNNIIIKKIKETPNKYPRKPGTPVKEPIV